MGTFSIHATHLVEHWLHFSTVSNGFAFGFYPIQCALKVDFFSRLYSTFSLPVVAVLLPGAFFGLKILFMKHNRRVVATSVVKQLWRSSTVVLIFLVACGVVF